MALRVKFITSFQPPNLCFQAIQTPTKWFHNKSTLIYNGIKQLNVDNDILNFHQSPIHSNQNIRAIVLATIHPNKGQNFVCKALENMILRY